jgi:hypothetical protein
MRALAAGALIGLVLVVFVAIRYLSHREHMDRSSGTDQFSPSDPAKTDFGPNAP